MRTIRDEDKENRWQRESCRRINSFTVLGFGISLFLKFVALVFHHHHKIWNLNYLSFFASFIYHVKRSSSRRFFIIMANSIDHIPATFGASSTTEKSASSGITGSGESHW
jgi:hypothetical protein